ncbi:MAG TPA: rubrerythrin family protein [Bacteroidota bacterium]|nr:rubrerythrin family protein [Bacteroidota bacterium]
MRLFYYSKKCSPTILFSIIWLLLPVSGCKQKSEEPKVTKPMVSLENLQIAYGKALKYQRMYQLFTAQAERERNTQVTLLYKALASSEEIHSNNHAKLLRAQGSEPKQPVYDSVVVGKTLQTLKMALSSEEIEVQSMYPNLIRSAELEKFQEAQNQFQTTLDADARHVELLNDALDRNGKIPKTQYLVCQGCGYIATSTIDVCPLCQSNKETFKKI